jgi:ABC-2 type transport system ATP-binding protein
VDNPAAIARLAEKWQIDAGIHDDAVTFSVPCGEEFVPELFAELGVGIRSVSVSRPSLDDVFMAHTGRTIRDTEAGRNLPPFMMARRRG